MDDQTPPIDYDSDGAQPAETHTSFSKDSLFRMSLLAGLVAVCFVGTGLLVRSYRAQEKKWGQEWFAAGQADLAASHPYEAVEAFQTALRYAPDDPGYQYALVEALLRAKRANQARSYLLTMWEREPASGILNLRLAEIAAERRDMPEAIRYYHNAIYGVWEDSAQQHRVQARLELARFLLLQNAKREAGAELVALAVNVVPSFEIARTLGKLFLQVGDWEAAAEQFKIALSFSPGDPEALVGAGRAVFERGNYSDAVRDLRQAKSRGYSDRETAQMLELSELILNSDPLDRTVSWRERAQRTMQALSAATNRVQQCAAQTGAASDSQKLTELLQRLEEAQDKKRLAAIRQDPDLQLTSTDLAFTAEEAAARICGQPEGLDLALLMIARSHPEVRD